ncbi:MAG: [protein-PII] uridylyltransferase [Planctomycetota bacterium]
MADGRSKLQEQHDLGMPALQVCGKLTGQADAAITGLFHAALEDIAPTDGERPAVALVAHGGYGRRQLAPHSDIDLMLLYGGPADRRIDQLAKRLTQDVFDIGLQLGQSLRTIDEALAMSRDDATVCTSLIESRLLVGDPDLYDSFREAFESMVCRRDRAMCESFIEARRQERDQYGETVFLLEPNIKRSRGALRDLHLLRWLWFTQTGVSDVDRLRMKGVISGFDHRRLTSSREFLLRVRNELHFHAGSASDLISRAEQIRIAEKLGYHGAEGLRPVEQFMRDYFRHASHIWFLAARVSELTTPRPAVKRVFGAMFSRNLERDYRALGGEIHATGKGRDRLRRRVDEVLRLVNLARLTDGRIGQDTWYLIYRSAPDYTSEPTADTARRFLDILADPNSLGDLLHRLHDLGVLEKIIPEFAAARCLLQFNQYHKFTVDEHCIRTVEEATRFANRDDQLGATYRGLASKRMLHLALLIHDLGKGHDRDHSEVGEEIAAQTAERLGLTRGEAMQLKFLVRHHLWMSHLTFRRDTGDQQLIQSFAHEVRSPETLKMLYLLTCADLAGVGPGVLNDWKVGLLTDLYSRALEVLQPEHRLVAADRRNAQRNAAWTKLSRQEQADDWFKRQFAELPESFLSSRTPEGVATSLRRLRGLTDGGGNVWGANVEADQTVEFITGVDQGIGRGIFSSMAGRLSAIGLKILTADSAVLADNLLLQRYVVERPTPAHPVPDDRLRELCDQLVAAVDDHTPPRFAKRWGSDQLRFQAELTNLPSDVRLDSSLSDTALIVEVFAINRHGLLYELSRAVHDLGLVIRYAKVATELDRVIDVFYVTERDGQKPTGDGRLQEIRDRLLAII